MMRHLNLGMAARPPSEPDVNDQEKGKAKAGPKMNRGDGWPDVFPAGIVEEPAGRDEERAEDEHACTGETIFPHTPGATYMQRQKDAENNEHQHRGGAMETKYPRRCWMSGRAKFRFCSSPLLENPPE